MNIASLHQLFLKCNSISIDTRTIKPGSLFFALKGENFDGNVFADRALENGAAYVIIDNKDNWKNSPRYILVSDSLSTLQELSHFHRKYANIPIISLTGSNGKTTTKELIHAALSKKYKTIATQGNLNNHIGVPLTLLSIDETTEIAIIEMGANHFGEIAALSKIAAPDYGYITNFGKAHLEGFGSLEGVIKAKSELYYFLRENNRVAFVNPKDVTQLQQTENQKRILLESVDLLDNQSEFVEVKYKETIIKTNLVGNYNINNIEAAIGIALHFEVDIIDIKKAIETYSPNNKRSQLIEKEFCKIILDAYNANPTSMLAAIHNFSRNNVKEKVIILADMFELGVHSVSEHQKIRDEVEAQKFDKVIFIGERFYDTQGKSALLYKTFEDFKISFKKSDYINRTILIKGSRGMAMERVVDLF